MKAFDNNAVTLTKPASKASQLAKHQECQKIRILLVYLISLNTCEQNSIYQIIQSHAETTVYYGVKLVLNIKSLV